MKYFSVLGRSVEEVTGKIFKEYGGKAYIITFTKEIKEESIPRSWYSRPFLKPQKKEIIMYKAYCGLPENNEEIPDYRSRAKQEAKNQLENSKKQTFETPIKETSNINETIQESVDLSGGLEAQNSLLRKELEDLRKMMSHLVYKESNLVNDDQINYLLQLDFSYDFAQFLVKSLTVPIPDLETFKLIIKEKIKLNMNIQNGLHYHDGEVYLFVGSTGVGKTTALAKVASFFYKEGLRDFTFYSFDSYRLGADEQLKRYAEVFEKDFYLIQNKKELENILQKTDKGSVVFIDTAGEGLEKEIKLSEIKEYLKLFNKRINTILVLSANSKIKDLVSIKAKFSFFDISAYIITKLDETKTLGSILEFIYNDSQNIPVVYYTNGQDVPDDMNKATAESFFKFF